MGSVEAALEVDTHDRIVALKRLLPDAARDKRRVEMFMREAKLASLLDHPNVVTAYDYGELDGELYLAMEYVEGQPLSRVLKTLAERGETLPVATVAYVLAEICRGLHAAHELTDPETKQPLNLVHRDVSPQNVMLGYDGRVRLLDFGVAKIETENATKTGEVKGKTAYMSPEQAMGDPLDRRSDFFGVGALLFECLALRRMWGDGTDMEVIRKLALDAPPTLDATGRTDVPAPLSALYAKLVAREREGRPATAAEIASQLDAFVPDAEHEKRVLRRVLEKHFADQAAEQRAKLSSSLQEVAPEQADALRESVLPSDRAADTGPRAPARDAAAAEPSPTRRWWVVAVPIAVIAAVAWRLAGGSSSAPPAPPPAPVVTTTSATAAPAPAPTPTALLPAPTASAKAAETTAPPPKPPVTIVPASPTVVRPSPAPPSATAPKASATTSASAKPRDVDDHPF